MVTDKRPQGLILKHKYLEPLVAVDDAERGRLLLALMIYSRGDMDEQEIFNNPRFNLSPVGKMAFKFIRPDIDDNIKEYQETCRKRAAGGKKGGRPKKNQPEDQPENQQDIET
jgi:hypothetical protein